MVTDRPEERYWADYLRISLPAAALLLLLGLFWYWAAALIGGGQASVIPTEVPTPSPTATVAPSPAATATAPAADEEAAPTPTPTVAVQAPADPATETPEETPAPTGCETDFDVGSTVDTVGEQVNLRAEPSTGAAVVATIANEATPLRVLGPVEVAEGCWWPVRNDATGDTGFIREDLLEAT